VGALKTYLTAVKEGKNPKQNNMIKSLNFAYSGPIDGHDLRTLIKELKRLQKVKGPKFLHVITTKGKGLLQAEQDQVKYHAPGKFDAATGELITKEESHLPTKFQDVFGHTLVELAQQNTKIIGITPAMPSGSSMKYMMEAFPERAFDVGIAEQHAVTLAAGMATQGMVVFCNIYSTFLQRAYDQVIHDVALQKLPVIFCLDRAGLVGEDGATHHGVFDLAYLRCVPNMEIVAPLDEVELRQLLYTASLGLENPIAIRYPRGRGVGLDWKIPFQKIDYKKGKVLHLGSDIAIISTGFIGNNALAALADFDLKEKVGLYHFGCVKPLDEALLHTICKQRRVVITLEDATIEGGLGSAVAEFVTTHDYKLPVYRLGIPDAFVEHGTVGELQKDCAIDVAGIRRLLNKLL
jgi:1-deoxy-D-xylulose-5-phosphate synthase